MQVSGRVTISNNRISQTGFPATTAPNTDPAKQPAGNAIVAVALSSATISGNVLHGNNGTGITVEGDNIVVQNNVVGVVPGAPSLVRFSHCILSQFRCMEALQISVIII
eukprot:m.1281894 g.1281894  ORF g.1281894 m.1281894 type:complete len:109 (+) comp24773_c2_seq39:1334-1660(+)